MKSDCRIAVVGLGYVGMPLAVLFSTKYPVIGYDINKQRVERLMAGHDDSGELSQEKLDRALKAGLVCTSDATAIADCNVYIVAVPTPVDKYNNPVLTPLEEASRTVGRCLKPGDYVVYESTVYPGTTEEVCLPILEQESGLKVNRDFFIGYSPERINPGDKNHTVENIVKVTSGSTPEAAEFIDNLYSSVLVNGTYRASSIQVAEAAKVIENTQRDVNIAFINEITKVFHVLGINTKEVIDAAASKWNFIPLRPGLVGGHCIDVDPYYLIQRAEFKGYVPELMRTARRINDKMGFYAASRVTTELNKRGALVREADILILGFSFKENCRDTRNTKVEDVYTALKSYTPNVYIYDPVIDIEATRMHYDVDITDDLKTLPVDKFDAIVQCVNHDAFEHLDVTDMLKPDGFIFYIREPEKHTEWTDQQHMVM